MNPRAYVTCKVCGLLLNERTNAAAAKRGPCPNCGSLSRELTVLAGPRPNPTAAATATRQERSRLLADRAQAMRTAGRPWKEIGAALDRDPASLQRAIRRGVSTEADETS